MLRCTQKVRSAFGTGKPRPRRRSAHDVEEAVYLSDEIAVMRPRPGRIVDRLNSPLSRPRPRSVVSAGEFIVLPRREFRRNGI
jgi:hypothetical protein